MIESFEISNFRCFKRLSQSGLKRFYFVVGESATGKTALLEALYLTAGASPDLHFRIRKWRGFGSTLEITGSRDSYESLFRDLFYDFDSTRAIECGFRASDGSSRKLEISYRRDDEVSVTLKGSFHPVQIVPIQFVWEIGGKRFESSVRIEADGLKMKAGEETYPIVFASSQSMSSRENARNYSELSKKRREKGVLAAVQAIFPQVQEISVEADAGEFMLHVGLENLPQRLPIASLSGGIGKYLTLVLYVISNPGGTILIDEIENGFYYRNLPDLLGSIVALCREHDVQLVATTHSYELLEALIPSMKDDVNDEFCLMRLERENGQPVMNLIPGWSAKAAMDMHYELR